MSKSNFCLIDSFCWIHDTGKHGAILEEFNNAVAFVIGSPVATNMAVKHVRNSILPLDVVLVMFMAMVMDKVMVMDMDMDMDMEI